MIFYLKLEQPLGKIFMNDYQIRFSPELAINPVDFAQTWNDSADCKELAEAQISSSAASYDIGSAFVLLSGIAIGVLLIRFMIC